MQKPSRETLFCDWSPGDSPGLDMETCDSLPLLWFLWQLNIYIYGFYGNYNIYNYTYMNEDVCG